MKAPLDNGCFPSGRHHPGIAHLLRTVTAGLTEQFPAERAMADIPFVAIDTETTGRDSTTDRVVELAAVVFRDGVVVARQGWLIQPGIPIPAEVTAIHGISDDDVRESPRFEQVLPEFLAMLEGNLPLAYNADFDRRFIMAEIDRVVSPLLEEPPSLRKSVEWLDPLIWARELQRAEKSKALGDVCTRLGIPLTQAHRATDDAEAAGQVLLKLRQDPRVPRTYGAFIQEQKRLARVQQDERARWRNR